MSEIDSLKLDTALDPIFTMLEFKKNVLSKVDWLSLVLESRRSILNTPTQYVDLEFFNEEKFKVLVDLAFTEFIDVELPSFRRTEP